MTGNHKNILEPEDIHLHLDVVKRLEHATYGGSHTRLFQYFHTACTDGIRRAPWSRWHESIRHI